MAFTGATHIADFDGHEWQNWVSLVKTRFFVFRLVLPFDVFNEL